MVTLKVTIVLKAEKPHACVFSESAAGFAFQSSKLHCSCANESIVKLKAAFVDIYIYILLLVIRCLEAVQHA